MLYILYIRACSEVFLCAFITPPCIFANIFELISLPISLKRDLGMCIFCASIARPPHSPAGFAHHIYYTHMCLACI